MPSKSKNPLIGAIAPQVMLELFRVRNDTLARTAQLTVSLQADKRSELSRTLKEAEQRPPKNLAKIAGAAVEL
jgi:hypothetical protein